MFGSVQYNDTIQYVIKGSMDSILAQIQEVNTSEKADEDILLSLLGGSRNFGVMVVNIKNFFSLVNSYLSATKDHIGLLK
jgi:hypothetical protein